MIPQAVTDALTALQASQDAAHADVAAQAATATALLAAQEADAHAKTDLASALADRDVKYAALQSVLAGIYQTPTP